MTIFYFLTICHLKNVYVAQQSNTFRLPKKTALSTRLNTLQLQLLEHGFDERFKRYDQRINWKALTKMYGKRKKKMNRKVKAIQLDDLYFVFHVYIILIPIYILVFLFELLLSKWHQKLVLPKWKKGSIMHQQRTKRKMRE